MVVGVPPFTEEVVEGLLPIGGEGDLVFDVGPAQVLLDQTHVPWIIFYQENGYIVHGELLERGIPAPHYNIKI